MSICTSLALALLALLPGSPSEPQAQAGAAAVPGRSRPARAFDRGRVEAEFRELKGVREFTARLIVRPLQRTALMAAGETLRGANARREKARRQLRAFELVRYVPETDEYVLRVPDNLSESQLAGALMASGEFEYATPDWRLFPVEPPARAQTGQTQANTAVVTTPVPAPTVNCPDDALFPLQWHHDTDRMASCEGWRLETGGPGITIGICDTGLLLTHEDLQLHRLEAYNAVDQLWESEGGDVGPVYYHGTRTTGAAAANGNNGLGVAGVGWDLSHRMLRVSNMSDGSAFLTDIQHGVRTSIESGDRVASVSYHGASSASNPATATYVKSLGGLMLWAAGNDSGNYSHADRDSDDLIVVGASDQNDDLAYFSAYGTFVDLVAPGVGIYTTDSSSDAAYVAADGTSYSCPIAAGVCALIWSARPNLSPNDVELLLKAGAEDLGALGVDDSFGYGRVNLLRSLAMSGQAVPVADFAGQPLSGRSPLPVDFQDLSTGVPDQWFWDFGDGTTSTQQNPSHTYTAPGLFTVSLTVSNELGADQDVRVAYVAVDVIPPIAAFSQTPSSGVSPLTVSFVDESTGGLPSTWLWDFGDGTTSVLSNPSHTYTFAGSFDVSLTVSNAYGSDSLTKSAEIVVDFVPPVADFSGTPTSGNSPYVVSFSDESSAGVATSWQWFFGDGGSSTLQHPAHTYTAQGTYSVTLTAGNAYGSDTLTKSNYITVGAGPELFAEFVGTPQTGTAPLTVSFTDLSVGNITSWTWNFGDGTTSTLQNPVHTFSSPGEYDIALEVGNATGADDNLEKQKYVVVN